MRIMILGASGYLGRKMTQYLKDAGHELTGVFRTEPEGVEHEKIKYISADIDVIVGELHRNKYECIVNCATVYERQGTMLHEVVDTNVIFALRVLNCAVECGVDKFVTLDTSLPRDLNLYSFTKKQFAEFGEYYSKRYGIAFVNILLEMFYGEDEPESRFLVGCCKKMLSGERLLLTEGYQKRDIIYIGDACRAIKLLIEIPIVGFHNVPLGSGTAVSIRNIIEYMHQVIGSESVLDFGAIPMRTNEPNCVADMTILKNMGFEPQYSWREGISYMCRKIKEDI